MIEKRKKYFDREKLLEYIKNARKEICILGVTAFALPWEELSDTLFKKLSGEDKSVDKENGFTLKILRESENAIAQYALLSSGKSNKGDDANNHGILKEISEDVLSFRNSIKSKLKSNQSFNIEPIEDVKKSALEILEMNIGCSEILKLVDYMDDSEPLFDELKSEIQNNLQQFLNRIFYKAMNGFYDELGSYPENIAIDSQANEKTAKSISEKLVEYIWTEKLNEIKRFKFDKKLESSGETFILDEGFSYEELKEYLIKYKVNEDKINKNIKDLQREIYNTIFKFEVKDEDENFNLSLQKTVIERKKTKARLDKLEQYNKNLKYRQRLFIKNCYMPIPIPMIKIDDDLFISQGLTCFSSLNSFQFIGSIGDSGVQGKDVLVNNKDGQVVEKDYKSHWIAEYKKYYDKYFVESDGAQKYATEETEKGDRKEVIDIFNEDRVRIGSGPRDAFLSNMAIVKLVVWAFIFTRDGKMLIHQRSLNAKDNRGLWDKSVGGHVSVEDFDTVESVKREIIEELYTVEKEGQGGHDDRKFTRADLASIIYLGDWDPRRYPKLKEIKLNPQDYYTFSLYSDHDRRKSVTKTERVLPDGERVEAKCFVDAYLSIVSEKFDVKELKNSKFALITPQELQYCVQHKKAGFTIRDGVRYYDKDAEEKDFNVTFDLRNLVDNEIWNSVVQFSTRVKDAFSNKN